LELLAPAYLVQSESDGSTTIQAESFTAAGAPGGLALPHKVLHVALPPQADLNSVTLEISSLQVEALPGNFHIQTLPPDSPDNAHSSGVSGLPSSNRLLPALYASLPPARCANGISPAWITRRSPTIPLLEN
jgi:hypothetical protein